MYSVDPKDRVIELADFPQSNVGAPLPSVVATEHTTALAFYLQDTPPDWDGTSVNVIDHNSTDLPLAIITFENCHVFMLGPPNDEAFDGHPLSRRGLHPYGAFKVENSSWVQSLEEMNSIHPHHSPDMFAAFAHFVIAFHDSTFECVAKSYTIELSRGSLNSALSQALRRLSD